MSPDPTVVSTFSNALNRSHLEILSLTTNRLLADSFAETFLPSLNTPHLREVHLSAIGISSATLPHILDYLSSSERCRLHTFKCNGNLLGSRAVRTIIRTIEQRNYRLSTVELYSNQLADEGEPSNASDVSLPGTESDDDGPSNWKDSDRILRRILARNSYLKRQTEQQALELLKYARTFLLHTTLGQETGTSSKTPRCCDTCSCIPSNDEVQHRDIQMGSNSPFLKLPIELQLYLLSFLAPGLSSAQRVRIYRYASSPFTLPPLLPCLPSSSSWAQSICLPDPSSLGYTSGKVWGVDGGGSCAAGKCMGSTNSVLCHRDQERSSWLISLGCDAYDPE